MEWVKLIIDTCTKILLIDIHVFDYTFSLLQVTAFSIVGGFLLWLMYRLAR